MKWTSLFVLSLSLAGCSTNNPNPRVATQINDKASIATKLPFNPLGQKVITSWIDRDSGTMSTLYGNDTAVLFARSHAGSAYPDGSVLSLVTWNQQEDPRWFGGYIPAKAKSVEFVVVQGTTAHYEAYTGQPLARTTGESAIAPSDRAVYLLGQRAAVMP